MSEESRHTAAPWRWLAIRIAALPLIFLAVSFAAYFLIYGPFARDPTETA